MENINIKINKKTRMITELPRTVIGNDGENLQENLVFSFDDEFVEGQARLELIKPDKTKSYLILSKVDETYQIPVKSVITKTGRLSMQLVIDEGTDENSVPIFKSNIFYVVVNSSINAIEEEPPESYESWLEIANAKLNQMDNLDIEASKVDDTTTITITKKDGTTETTEINDGIDGNGIASITTQESQIDEGNNVITITDTNGQVTTFIVKNGSKGSQGEPGAIKMVIVNQLPSTGADDTIYLVPLATPESQENNYAEYIYINGNWELLGKIGIHIDLSNYYTKTQTDNLLNGKADTSDIPDLTDYVKNTNYASRNVAGVIKTGNGTTISGSGILYPETYTIAQYPTLANNIFIGKGSLENAFAAKDFVNKTYVDNLVGDISSAIDLINGESV